MQINHLNEFLTLANKLSFKKTADLHFLSQPTLSSHIKTIESELRCKLFHRPPDAISLTVCGKEALPLISDIVSLHDKLVQQCRSHEPNVGSRVTIGFTGLSSRTYLSQLIKHCSNDRPKTSIDLKTGIPSSEINRLVSEQQIDIGVTFEEPHQKSLDYLTIQEHKLYIAMSSDHRLAGKRDLTFKDLAPERFVTYEADKGSYFNAHVIRQSQAFNFQAKIQQESNDMLSLLTLVSAGVGIFLCTDVVAQHGVPGVVFCPIITSGDLPRSKLIWSSGERRGDVRAVIDCARDIILSRAV